MRLSLIISVIAVGVIAGCRSEPAAHAHAHAHGAAGHTAHWSYSGDTGPQHWGSLAPEYQLCSTGKSQSPIDITATDKRDVPDIVFAYQPAAATVVNNGHTIQANIPAGSSITLDGTVYQLAQFHFHAPSEHTVNGKHAAAEMHLVHKSAAGALAVVGVMIESGAESSAFGPFWSTLPTQSGASVSASINPSDLLPQDKRTIRYSGSLTTPPGTEGVHWNLLVQPIAMSPAQIAAFTALYNGNNRPVQALNGRAIVEDTVAQ